MNFSQELRKRRHKSLMTMRDLESKTGIGNPTLSKYESGTCVNPSFRNAIALSHALNWDISSMARFLEKTA